MNATHLSLPNKENADYLYVRKLFVLPVKYISAQRELFLVVEKHKTFSVFTTKQSYFSKDIWTILGDKSRKLLRNTLIIILLPFNLILLRFFTELYIIRHFLVFVLTTNNEHYKVVKNENIDE